MPTHSAPSSAPVKVAKLLFVLHPNFLVLTPSECDVLRGMEEVWLSLEANAPFKSPADLRRYWGEEVVGALSERYCPKAREIYERFGSAQAFEDANSIAERGRHSLFHSTHAPEFPVLVHPIAKRIRERALNALEDYRAQTAALRDVYGIGPVFSDDVTTVLDSLIARCVEVEELRPTTYRPGWSGHFRDLIHEME